MKRNFLAGGIPCFSSESGKTTPTTDEFLTIGDALYGIEKDCEAMRRVAVYHVVVNHASAI